MKTSKSENVMTDILIVEDSKTQALELQMLLEQNEYRVKVAENGKIALSLLKDYKPDIVISDIVMPEMNGYELCRWIKDNEATMDIPVILLTSLSYPEDVLEGLECGADIFITKPYESNYLLNSLERILSSNELRKTERIRIGVEIMFGGKRRFITADQQQVLTLLLSTYEAAVNRNSELIKTQEELKLLNEQLEELVEKRTEALTEEIKERKRAEAAIKESEMKYRKLFDDDLTGDYISSVDGTILLCNPALASIFGFNSVEELMNENITSFYKEPDNQEEFLNLLRKKKSINLFEREFIRQDGKIISVIENVTGEFDENGELVRVKGYLFDDTERKTAENKQILTVKILSILNRPNEWQQLVKDILEEIKKFTDFEAIGIRLKEGEDFPYFETNGFPPHFVDLERSLCARNLNDEIIRDSHNKPILECICGNVISGLTDPTKKFLTKGGSFWTNCTTELFTISSKEDWFAHSRNHCDREGYESVALIPIHSGNEKIGLLQLNDKRTDRFTLDLIEFFEKIGSTIGIAFNRMQSENKIKESEERFRALFEQAAVGFAQINSGGQCVYVNNKYCSITGYSKEELLRNNFNDITYPDDLEKELQCLQQLIKGEITDYSIEKRYFHKNGSLIWVNLTASPLWQIPGETDSYVSIIEDITETKQAREQIEKSLKEKEILLREIHHRVKNNMQVISSMLKLQANYVDNKEVIAAFEDSNLRIRSMSLVHEKLYRSQNLSRIDFKEYIRTLTNELARANNADMSKIQIDITDISAVSLDIDYAIPCGLLINELVSNAFKYAFPGYKNRQDFKKGLIKITLCTTGVDDIELEVSDNGVGLPGDFSLIESKTLGLHLVSILVENQLNGILEVTSDNGTKFKIKFKEKANG